MSYMYVDCCEVKITKQIRGMIYFVEFNIAICLKIQKRQWKPKLQI